MRYFYGFIALIISYVILRFSYGEDIANGIGILFGFLVLTGALYIYQQKEAIDNKKDYENKLKYLRENPEDPGIRAQCFSAGEAHYKKENPKLSILELTSLINTDINKYIGHLEFQKR